eukprot:6564373-Lingulodinium_polyedra.AAC.1
MGRRGGADSRSRRCASRGKYENTWNQPAEQSWRQPAMRDWQQPAAAGWQLPAAAAEPAAGG